MKYSETYTLTLEKIAWLAQSIQAEINTFQPDLIIVLARGGFAPLWALQALWEGTKQDQTPPVVITNLGREKLRRYEYHREAIGVNHMPLLEPFDFYGACERGYFLAWLEKQTDWRNELRQQITTELAGIDQPARILVIDDTVNKRYTTLITLGLLLAEFPFADTRMLAGDLPDWRQDLAAPLAHGPQSEAISPNRKRFIGLRFNLAPGASDLNPEFLQWEPLNAGSLSIREYGKFLPVETWLELSGWLKEQIKTFVQHSAIHPEVPLIKSETGKKTGDIYRPVLEPEELFFRQRWLSAGITPQEASDELNMSVNDAIQLLKNLAR